MKAAQTNRHKLKSGGVSSGNPFDCLSFGSDEDDEEEEEEIAEGQTPHATLFLLLEYKHRKL